MDALTCRLATTFASINSLVSQVFQKPGRPKCSQAIIESKILRRIQSHPSYRTFIQASSIHQPSFTSYSPSSILSQIQMHPSYRTFVGPVTRPLGPKNQESKIESLPNEIQVMIMRQLRDVPSLRSLSASSRSLNELRLSHASVILPSVLRTELGEGVLTDALWVMKASEIDWDSSNYRRNLQTFMEDWSDPMSTTLLLSNAPLPYYVEIARFLPRLWGLVKGFCDHAWSTPIMSSSMLDSELQISSSEKVRIARALLRIQFYCFLYATPREAECEHVYEDGKSYEVQCQSYKVFGHWKAWEIEEIACVRDYIYFKLAEVFQNIRREAAKSPLDIVILQPWDDEPDVVNSNQVIFDDDFLPSWVDASSPCGANLSPEGKSTAFVSLLGS